MALTTHARLTSLSFCLNSPSCLKMALTTHASSPLFPSVWARPSPGRRSPPLCASTWPATSSTTRHLPAYQDHRYNKQENKWERGGLGGVPVFTLKQLGCNGTIGWLLAWTICTDSQEKRHPLVTVGKCVHYALQESGVWAGSNRCFIYRSVLFCTLQFPFDFR